MDTGKGRQKGGKRGGYGGWGAGKGLGRQQRGWGGGGQGGQQREGRDDPASDWHDGRDHWRPARRGDWRQGDEDSRRGWQDDGRHGGHREHPDDGRKGWHDDGRRGDHRGHDDHRGADEGDGRRGWHGPRRGGDDGRRGWHRGGDDGRRGDHRGPPDPRDWHDDGRRGWQHDDGRRAGHGSGAPEDDGRRGWHRGPDDAERDGHRRHDRGDAPPDGRRGWHGPADRDSREQRHPHPHPAPRASGAAHADHRRRPDPPQKARAPVLPLTPASVTPFPPGVETPAVPAVRVCVASVVGPPGSGKTTLGRALADSLGGAFFSVGELLRAEKEKRKELFAAQFNLDEKPPAEVKADVFDAVGAWLDKGLESGVPCFVVDCPPINSVEFLFLGHELQSRGLKISVCLNLQDCVEDELVRRMLARGRDGDEKRCKARLRQFRGTRHLRRDLKLAGESCGAWRDLDASQPPHDVFRSALEAVEPAVRNPPDGFLPPFTAEEPCLVPVASARLTAEILAVLRQRASDAGCPPGIVFPGSQVAGFLIDTPDGVRNSSAVQDRVTARSHLVSLKLDGVRFLLLHQALKRQWWLIPRSADVAYAIRLRAAVAPQNNDYVLDGELVRDESGGWRFAVFDMVCCSAARLRVRDHRWTLSHRMDKLDVLGLPPIDCQAPPGDPSSVLLCRKAHLPLTSLRQLVETDKLHDFLCKTDGIIFTPKGPYRDGVDVQLIKWKPPQAQTCDFVLEADPSGTGECALMAWGPDGLTKAGTITLAAHDALSLNGNLVECKVCPDGDGVRWEFVRVRTDKTTPNQLAVVKQVSNVSSWVRADDLVALGEAEAAPVLTGADAVVSEHYDRVTESAYIARDRARYDFLFNGWVRQGLAQLLPARASILDLGCGRGGDVARLAVNVAGGPSLYVGMDIAAEALRQACARLSQRPNIPAALCVGSLLEPTMPERLESAVPGTFDVVWCQMTLHYACGSEDIMRRLLRMVSHRLRAGGMFVVTTVDSRALRARAIQYGDQMGRHYAHGLHKIQCSPEVLDQLRGDGPLGFGLRYRFALQGAVEACEEFVAPREAIVAMAAEEGMVLDEERSVNFERARSWVRQGCHPRSEKCLELAQKSSLLGSGPWNSWELSSPEQEVVTLYSVLKFKQERAGAAPTATATLPPEVTSGSILDLTRLPT